MLTTLYGHVRNFVRSFWLIDVHRGVIDMTTDNGYSLSIPFNAQCRQRLTGTRRFRRIVLNHAIKLAGDAESRVMRVRMQEKSVLGTVVILRKDSESADGMSVENVNEPKFRDIALFGDESLLLVNL